MRILIAQIRAALPLDAGAARLCRGDCRICALKLLEFMETLLGDWEQRLDAGETPGLADLSRLARQGHKIHRALATQGLVAPSAQPQGDSSRG